MRATAKARPHPTRSASVRAAPSAASSGARSCSTIAPQKCQSRRGGMAAEAAAELAAWRYSTAGVAEVAAWQHGGKAWRVFPQISEDADGRRPPALCYFCGAMVLQLRAPLLAALGAARTLALRV
eukprot:gene8282-biopygen748